MKGNPLVSVIIPTYNRGWILPEAIDSVLVQEFTNFELIVVDDGSTDNTASILDRYGKDIHVIRQTNQGVSAARNSGIRHAKGELISFLDSDDLWLPRKLLRQTAFFEAAPHVLICQTEEIWVRNGCRVNPKNRHQKPSGDIFSRSLHLCLVSPSAVMMRRTLFDDIGLFDEQYPACEDYDLWLRISSRHPVSLIDEPLIIKRGGHKDQLSRQPSLDRYRIASLKNLLDQNMLTFSQRQETISVLVEKCTIYAGGCRKRNRHEEAAYYQTLVDRFSS